MIIAALLSVALAAPLAAGIWRAFAEIETGRLAQYGDAINGVAAALILILIFSGVIR